MLIPQLDQINYKTDIIKQKYYFAKERFQNFIVVSQRIKIKFQEKINKQKLKKKDIFFKEFM